MSILHFGLALAVYFSVLGRDGPDRFRRPSDVVFLCLVGLLSAFFLNMEARRLIVEGVDEYLVGQAHWKLIAVSCFVTQLVVDVLVVLDARRGRGTVAAFNVVLFTFHTFSFARGFESFGTLVNIIIQTCYAARAPRPLGTPLPRVLP